MAKRPVYILTLNESHPIKTLWVEFTWHPGFSVVQKQKSIASLHENAQKMTDIEPQNMLEVSRKSPDAIGNELSAFKLKFNYHDNSYPVESLFQGSKVFEKGGPFQELYTQPPKMGKKMFKERAYGNLTHFQFYQIHWPNTPKEAFYNWLYLSALNQHPTLWQALESKTLFTDIEFNPQKSLNCQAYSVALFLHLKHFKMLEHALQTPENFIEYLKEIKG